METKASGYDLSVRQLSLIFVALVVLCGMFFALGFIVARNQQPAVSAPTVERIPPPGATPPEVNAPLQSSSLASSPPSNAKSSSSGVIEQDLKGAGGVASAQAQPTPAVSSTATSSSTVSPAPAPAAAAPQGMMVQVLASRSKENAQSLVNRLKRDGYPAKLITPQEAGEGGHVFRVQVGPFKSRETALRVLRRLSRQGFKPFIKE